MPYPFAPLPTFAELRAILEQEFGCEFKKDDSIIVELGDSYPVTYFERDMGGEVLTCVVVAPKDKTSENRTRLLEKHCRKATA